MTFEVLKDVRLCRRWRPGRLAIAGNVKDTPPPVYPEEAGLDLDGPGSSTSQGHGMEATVSELRLRVVE
jgi:hypothetical protein